MNATKLALMALTLVLLASAPAQAEGQDQPEDDPCPAVQTMPHDPYVSVQPDCIDDIPAWVLRQG